MNDYSISEAQIKFWYECIKLDREILKNIHILEDLQQAVYMKMLNMFCAGCSQWKLVIDLERIIFEDPVDSLKSI